MAAGAALETLHPEWLVVVAAAALDLQGLVVTLREPLLEPLAQTVVLRAALVGLLLLRLLNQALAEQGAEMPEAAGQMQGPLQFSAAAAAGLALPTTELRFTMEVQADLRGRRS